MEHNTLFPREHKRRLIRRKRMIPATIEYMEVEGSSLQNLFKNSLKGLACKLNRELTCTVGHYDCVMTIKATAQNSDTLLMRFLAKVLELTTIQKAVFCNLYLEKFTENELVGQVYGCWFDHLDLNIKSVANCFLNMNPDGESWEGSITFDI